MNEWVDRLRALREEGTDAVIVTIAGVRGSAPREIGAKMIVTRQQSFGSIGGGQLEYQCARLAFGQLGDDCASGRVWRRFPLGADLGQCCGGVVEVLFERLAIDGSPWFDELYRLYAGGEPLVMATSSGSKHLVTANGVIAAMDCGVADEIVGIARTMLQHGEHAASAGTCAGQRVLFEPIVESGMNVAIFGAGHVGSACVAALSRIDCRIRWIDSRRNVFPDSLPAQVTRMNAANPVLEVNAMPPGAYYLVMTHSHPLDYDICHRILLRNDFSYCGLIGSHSKRRRFEKLMRSSDLPASVLDRLTCPVGVSGIQGKKPAEIAIAVAAELLQTRDAAETARSRDHEWPSLAVVAQSD